LQFRAFEARRYQDVQAKQAIRVDHNSTLSLVQKEGDDRLRVDFTFTTSYGPLGMVKVEGGLLWRGDDADAIVTQWQKDRTLPPERAQEIHSAILGACIPEAVGLAKGLRLPPPLPIPQVRFQGKGQAEASAAPMDSPDAA
jgi:hypothetical protein